GNCLDIAGTHQVVERLRSLFLVFGVSVNLFAQCIEVLAQHAFFCLQNGLPVDRHRHCQQNPNDADNDHQLDECEASALAFSFTFRARGSAGVLKGHGFSCAAMTGKKAARDQAYAKERAKIKLGLEASYHSEYFVPSSAVPCDLV